MTSDIVGRDLIKDPGLHRSLIADGLSNVLSGLAGSTPNTTYGENMGVMAITGVYSTWVIGGAASSPLSFPLSARRRSQQIIKKDRQDKDGHIYL